MNKLLQQLCSPALALSVAACAYLSGCPQMRQIEVGERTGRTIETDKPPDIVWNAWAEESTAPTLNPTFKTINSLKPDKFYLTVLDLSSVSYRKNDQGVLVHSPSAAFKRQVAEWVKNPAIKSVSLTVVLLPDQMFFEIPSQSVSKLDVNIEKIRNLMTSGGHGIEGDPLDILARTSDPDFVFGRIAFRIKTKPGPLEGAAPISISLWVDDRPVDEISFQLCVTSDSTFRSQCGGIAPSPFGLKGIDSLRVAAESGAPHPDAALHFVELESKRIFGVFHKSAQPDSDFVAWPLATDADSLRKLLTNWIGAIKETRDNGTELLKRGQGLYNALFPPEQETARAAFESFVQPSFRKDPSTLDYRAPSIFVRLIQQGPEPPLLIPLGMIALKAGDTSPKFLGFYFRIEAPLEMQNYNASVDCLARWAIVSPGPQVTDEPLKAARDQAKNRLLVWEKEAQEGPFHEMKRFGDWVASETSTQGTVLVVLSHHTRDMLSFEADDLVFSREVVRKFKRPSVVILNGCESGGPGAVDFVRRFNIEGIGTVIATSTEVNARMAGDFYDCLGSVIEKHQTDSDFNIAHAHFRTLQCLRTRENPRTNRIYGGKVLEYTLLGNGNVKLCSPKKEIRQ